MRLLLVCVSLMAFARLESLAIANAASPTPTAIVRSIVLNFVKNGSPVEIGPMVGASARIPAGDCATSGEGAIADLYIGEPRGFPRVSVFIYEGGTCKPPRDLIVTIETKSGSFDATVRWTAANEPQSIEVPANIETITPPLPTTGGPPASASSVWLFVLGAVFAAAGVVSALVARCSRAVIA